MLAMVTIAAYRRRQALDIRDLGHELTETLEDITGDLAEMTIATGAAGRAVLRTKAGRLLGQLEDASHAHFLKRSVQAVPLLVAYIEQLEAEAYDAREKLRALRPTPPTGRAASPYPSQVSTPEHDAG